MQNKKRRTGERRRSNAFPMRTMCQPMEPRVLLSATYYVSSTGNDNNSGLARTSAWRSVDRVTWANLQAGDVVLFQGGATFGGKLAFDTNDKGTASAPITIGSYGTGRATINGGSGGALYAANVAGLVISNLNFVGSGATSDAESGLLFQTNLSGNVKLSTIRIDNVDVSGFYMGIRLEGHNQFSGYQDVRITNSKVHDNAIHGISTALDATVETPATTQYPHANFYIGTTSSYGNLYGSGIYLQGVQGASVERCVTYNNGALGWGAIGVMASQSTNIVFQYNESYANRTAYHVDGGGFDFDSGVTNSIMQYNYAHNNDGAGYLVAQWANQRPNYGNTIRFNISENDARNTGYGAIHIWNDAQATISNTEVYNNTIYITPAAWGTAMAVGIDNWNGNALHFRNNILQTTGNVPLVGAWARGTDLVFQGNDYWTTGGTWLVYWSGVYYTSLGLWQKYGGQEMLNGKPVGFTVDPQFTNPGGGGTLGDAALLANMTAYRLKNTSPLLTAGLNLTNLFGLAMGGLDFYGSALGGQKMGA